MREAFRFLALLLVPSCVAVALHYETGPTQIRIQQQAGEWVARALSDDPAITRAALTRPDARLLKDARVLDWSFRLSIVLVMLGASLLIPGRTASLRAANLFTALAGGFVLAFVLIGFNHMRWDEFLGTLAVATTGGFALWIWRNRQRQAPRF